MSRHHKRGPRPGGAVPGQVQAKLQLGMALHQQGRLAEAERAYRELLQKEPAHFDALHLLGVIAFQTGQTERSIRLITKAIDLDPDFAAPHFHLGCALAALKRFEEALASYDRAIALQPDYAKAYGNRGVALSTLKRFEEALASLDKAIALRPDYAEACNNRGNALRDLERFGEALASYDRAVALKPDYAEAHSNRGNALRDLKRYEEALASYGQAIALKPDYAEPHYNLGLALDRLGRAEAAAGSARRALAITPDYPEALALLVQLRQQTCDWDGLEAEIARNLDSATHGAAISPFMVLTQSASPEFQLACARRWAEKHVGWIERRFAHTQPVAERRIRLGYLSADFRTHAVAYLAAELFERHDRARFEVVGYSLGADDSSAMRRRLEKGFDRFVDLRALLDAEAAGRIHGDGIDILVDLTGYTGDARTKILAARPAPIQVNWLGYPGTMGADFMDYILVDAFAVPPEQQPFFTEKLVHLPHCYQSNDTVRKIAETIPTRAECGLPEGAFVFCCFNNSYKITARFFALWMDLLAALPESVLWLLGDEAVQRNLSGQAAARGIDPARLVFAPRLPLAEHLARHRQADLFLDTLPYNAHTTASDALWAGLPVLTLAGECFPGRVAGSLLHAVGLPELVTTSEAEYRALALRLAREPALLKQYRQRLAENRTTAPLFDTGRFARDIEAAYERMWQHWRDGKPAASLQAGIR